MTTYTHDIKFKTDTKIEIEATIVSSYIDGSVKSICISGDSTKVKGSKDPGTFTVTIPADALNRDHLHQFAAVAIRDAAITCSQGECGLEKIRTGIAAFLNHFNSLTPSQYAVAKELNECIISECTID
jgi:hypothetical protein